MIPEYSSPLIWNWQGWNEFTLPCMVWIYSCWNVKWLTQYLCCLWTKMAEIWFPDTFLKDVYTCKILALHHFYFLSYDTFSWWISNFSGIEWFPWLSLYNSESMSDRELKFCMCKHLENLWLKKKFQPFWAIKNRVIGWATWRSREPLDVPRTVYATLKLVIFSNSKFFL